MTGKGNKYFDLENISGKFEEFVQYQIPKGHLKVAVASVFIANFCLSVFYCIRLCSYCIA